MKKVVAWTSLLIIPFCSSPAHAAKAPAPINVSLTFEGQTANQLRAVQEQVDVVAHFYGTPKDENDPELTDSNHFISREVLSVYPQDQTITVGGTLSGAPMKRTTQQFIGITAQRSSYTDASGELDCNQVELSLVEAHKNNIEITCRVSVAFEMPTEE